MRTDQASMNFKRLLVMSCAGLLLCGLVACGGGSSPSEPTGGYKPVWDLQWANTDLTLRYNFDPVGGVRNVETGSLGGIENRNGDVRDLQGSFNNRNFQFSVDRNQDGTFEFPVTGFWVDDNTLRLTSTDGTILVRRQPG